MKNIKTLIAVLSATALSVSLVACSGGGEAQSESSASDSSVRTIYAATAGSPAPYISVGDGNQIEGQNYDLVNEIFSRLPQYDLQWERVESAALFSGLDSGRYQIGVNNYAKNEEREEKYLFSDPIYQIRYVAYTTADANPGFTELNSFSQLAGHSVLTNPGGALSTALEHWNEDHPDEQMEITYTGSGQDLSTKFRQIESGVAEFGIDDLPIFELQVEKNGFELQSMILTDQLIEEIGRDSYAYLLFPKGEDQLVADVNAVLKELYDDGTSAKLTEQWFHADLSVDPANF